MFLAPSAYKNINGIGLEAELMVNTSLSRERKMQQALEQYWRKQAKIDELYTLLTIWSMMPYALASSADI